MEDSVVTRMTELFQSLHELLKDTKNVPVTLLCNKEAHVRQKNTHTQGKHLPYVYAGNKANRTSWECTVDFERSMYDMSKFVKNLR